MRSRLSRDSSWPRALPFLWGGREDRRPPADSRATGTGTGLQQQRRPRRPRGRWCPSRHFRLESSVDRTLGSVTASGAEQGLRIAREFPAASPSTAQTETAPHPPTSGRDAECWCTGTSLGHGEPRTRGAGKQPEPTVSNPQNRRVCRPRAPQGGADGRHRGCCLGRRKFWNFPAMRATPLWTALLTFRGFGLHALPTRNKQGKSSPGSTEGSRAPR